MPADSSDVGAALSAKLLTDTQLTAAMPDGVYTDIPAKGATRFVVVSLSVHEDEYMFGGSAYERFLYLVKAVALSSAGGDVKAAAARIHALLQDGTLTVPGYGLMRMQRTEFVRASEPGVDMDTRWQHRGGYYEIVVSP